MFVEPRRIGGNTWDSLLEISSACSCSSLSQIHNYETILWEYDVVDASIVVMVGGEGVYAVLNWLFGPVGSFFTLNLARLLP